MRIIPLTPEYAPAWDACVDRHRAGWFWHRSDWLAYEVAFAGAENLSFMVEDGEDLVGAVPLLREGGGFSMEGHPLPLALLGSEKAGRFCNQEVDRLRQKHGITRVAFRTCPLAEWAISAIDPRWRDISWPSRVLDLTQSVETLHAGVRKSYRHLINRGRQTWERWDCAGNPEAFHLLWADVNGHRRHPVAERLMSDWLKTGHAKLLGAWRGGRWEAFCYASVYKNQAYYTSAPSLVKGAMHMLVWDMILALKAEGIERLELGWQARPGDSDKDRGIAQFKAGFGGQDRPVYAVERA